MPAAELRALLKKAKRRPMSCVIALTKDKQGVILLDRRRKPRKLMGELRSQAKAAGLELDTASIRFGRASVDGASDSAQVNIAVNKPVPGAMRLALLPQLRAAGMQRCTINVDEAIETETDDGEDEPDDEADDKAPGAAEGGAALAPGDAAVPGGATSAAAGGGAATPAQPGAALSQPDAAASGNPAHEAGAGRPAPAGPGAAGGTAAPGVEALRTRLTPLARRTVAAVKSGQPEADTLRAAANKAGDALASGNLAVAGQAMDALERLLEGGPQSAAPPGSANTAPASGAAAPDARPPDGSTGRNGPAGAAVLTAALTSLARQVAPAIAADPSRKEPLLTLANEAHASIKAGNTQAAATGIKALHKALPSLAAQPGSVAVAEGVAAPKAVRPAGRNGGVADETASGPDVPFARGVQRIGEGQGRAGQAAQAADAENNGEVSSSAQSGAADGDDGLALAFKSIRGIGAGEEDALLISDSHPKNDGKEERYEIRRALGEETPDEDIAHHHPIDPLHVGGTPFGIGLGAGSVARRQGTGSGSPPPATALGAAGPQTPSVTLPARIPAPTPTPMPTPASAPLQASKQQPQRMSVASGRLFDVGGRQWVDAATGQATSPPVLGTDVRRVGTQVSGKFTNLPQAPNSVMYRLDQAGNISNYQVWGDDGLPAYRVDVQGASHGGVATPHTIHYPRNVDRSGQARANAPTRPMPALQQEMP